MTDARLTTLSFSMKTQYHFSKIAYTIDFPSKVSGMVIKATTIRLGISLSSGAPNVNLRENICSEDDLRSRIFGTFAVKFLACLPLVGFSNI